MTTLTVPSRARREAGRRQHRIGLAGVVVILGASAVYLWITGRQIHHAYAVVAACHPAGSIACVNMGEDFITAYWSAAEIIAALVQAVPALIGAFIGAPVLSRELETGTFRYAWTQGIGRWRWTVAKLVLLAAAVTAAAAAFSVLFSWYLGPFLAEGQQTSLAPTVFDLRGVAFAAWTLAAFALGALAGVTIRRVVPAMAATLAGYVGLACAAGLYLRQHYLTPLVRHDANLPGSAWMTRQWYTGADGRPLSSAAVNQILGGYHPAPTQVGPNSFQTDLDPVRYLSQRGYSYWVTYQPGSRFWPFQWIEGGWLLTLSLLLIATTLWVVRRRTS
jgi:ABC-2 family transporter protein